MKFFTMFLIVTSCLNAISTEIINDEKHRIKIQKDTKKLKKCPKKTLIFRKNITKINNKYYLNYMLGCIEKDGKVRIEKIEQIKK